MEKRTRVNFTQILHIICNINPNQDRLNVHRSADLHACLFVYFKHGSLQLERIIDSHKKKQLFLQNNPSLWLKTRVYM